MTSGRHAGQHHVVTAWAQGLDDTRISDLGSGHIRNARSSRELGPEVSH